MNKRKPSPKQFSCYFFKSLPLTQNCNFGAPGHRTKSWGFEGVWTHGGREKKGGKMGMRAKMRAIKSHDLYCVRGRISCEYSFTLLKLQSAEVTLKHQVKVTTIIKIQKILVRFCGKKKFSCFPLHSTCLSFFNTDCIKTRIFYIFFKVNVSYMFFCLPN